MVDASGGRYHVVFSGIQTARVRDLANRAVRRGLRESFVTALRVVTERLATNPLEWGDPYSHLEDLGLMLYHRCCTPLNVFYAVDPLRRIVYIKDVDPLPGYGLDPRE